ncbi:hypothetical protein CCHOA_01380 [Corynebacterium choanae]|uniref:Uncharacterized protein n=1 Tax=Corynebacterium choanae TaxID=1862358 RepID=A0A3G6J9J8_9CORY|nr:hypothetical protein CCHOA_01380 [Corynebacterium choanae]
MGWWCRQGLWRKKRGISFLGLLFCCHCCSGGRNRRFETHFLTLKPSLPIADTWLITMHRDRDGNIDAACPLSVDDPGATAHASHLTVCRRVNLAPADRAPAKPTKPDAITSHSSP